MMNYQTLFDDIVLLLQKNSDKDEVVKQCLEDCELELAFSPPQKNSTVAKDVLLGIYEKSDRETYKKLKPWFDKSSVTALAIWYIDTENNGYTVFTDGKCNELVGIKLNEKSLQDIRRDYFTQKERLLKIGEEPAHNYDEKEITFINKKWVK